MLDLQVGLTLISACAVVSVDPLYLNSPTTAINNKFCNSLTNCLDYAMNVVHNSDRYNLFESLWFDAINGTNHSYVITTSDPKNFTDLVKKATQLFDTHYLIWKVAPGVNVKVFKKDEDKFGMSVLRDVYPQKQEGRTFGVGKRRIMMALLPIMYKLGVITTLLVALTVLTLKGLTIGVILLMLSFGGIVSKLKSAHHYEPYHSAKKDIHIHVHPWAGAGGLSKPDHYYHEEYPSWNRANDVPQDDLTTERAASSPSWSYLPPFMSY